NRLGAGLEADRLLFRVGSRLHKNRSIVLQSQLRPAFGLRFRRFKQYPFLLRGTEVVEEQLSQFPGKACVVWFLRQPGFKPGAGYRVGTVCQLIVAALGKMSGQLGLELSVIRRGPGELFYQARQRRGGCDDLSFAGAVRGPIQFGLQPVEGLLSKLRLCRIVEWRFVLALAGDQYRDTGE